MPRDYKTRASAKKKKPLPGYVWLLSGLGIGLFIAFIVYLDKQPETDKSFGDAVQQELSKLKQKNREQESKKAAAKKIKATQKKEQKFNFYTLLPELEVLIPESETRPPDVKNNSRISNTKTNNKTPSVKKKYALQVGSFQNLGDAEKLKANLAFLGLEANIQHVTVNRQSWHRVRTGPYQSKQQLYKNQKILKRNNIHSISMQLK